MNQNENGRSMRCLAASEQFSTKSCVRCAGLLVNDWSYYLENTGEHVYAVLRCVQCGHRVDPVILQNQIHRWSKASATAGAQTSSKGQSWWETTHVPHERTNMGTNLRERRMT